MSVDVAGDCAVSPVCGVSPVCVSGGGGSPSGSGAGLLRRNLGCPASPGSEAVFPSVPGGRAWPFPAAGSVDGGCGPAFAGAGLGGAGSVVPGGWAVSYTQL
ncbi:hypothetical protein, partial [Actinomadura sp. 6K520]|uniref:hypothetical protein n=1 Tax=Actinomadura sp. 6K520 TaxID=2530364 RepID=UPI001A9D9F91